MQVTLGALFPVGTLVGVYPETERARASMRQSPTSPAIETEVVDAASVVEFTGLAADTKFYAAGQVDGDWVWVAFSTPGSQGAIYEIDDPEDLPFEILVPAGQTEDVFRVVKGDTELFAIDSDGVISAQGAPAAPTNAVASPYFADRTGASSASAAIQAAIDDVEDAGGGRVYLPAGTYKLTTALTLPSNVELVGDGKLSTLDFSAKTGTFEAISAVGTLGGAIALTVNAAEHATSVTVGAGHGLVAGDWVHLNSAAVAGVENQPQGEILRVASKTDTVITFDGYLQDAYLTADVARLQKITPVEGCGLRDIRLLGPVDNTLEIIGARFELCRDVELVNVVCERTHEAGLELDSCWDSRVASCSFKDIELVGFAYGLVLGWACQDVTVTGCTARRMRHFVTIGGGTSKRGIARRVTITGNTAVEMTDAGIDCHAAGEDIEITGNTIGGAPGGTGDGIVFQGTSATITGNTVRSVGRHGILVQPLTVRPANVVVNGNRVNRTGDRGIYLQPSAAYTSYDAVEIVGNAITNAGSNGLEVGLGAGTVTISGLVVAGNTVKLSATIGVKVMYVADAAITGNRVRHATGREGIYLDHVTDSTVSGNSTRAVDNVGTIGIRQVTCTDVEITGNRTAGAATGISFDDGSTYCTVIANNARGCTTPLALGAGTGHISTTADAAGAYNQG